MHYPVIGLYYRGLCRSPVNDFGCARLAVNNAILDLSQAAVWQRRERSLDSIVSHVEELESLLSESSEAAMSRESSAFDLAAGRSDNIVLFGAGGLGRRTLAGMRRIGLSPAAFCDNNRSLDGHWLEGVEIHSTERAAAKFAKSAVFVISIWNGQAKDRMAQRIEQLRKAGCSFISPVGLLYWKYPDAFLPYYALDLPHKVLVEKRAVQDAFTLFSDEESRREFVAQVRFRLLLDYNALELPSSADHYFPADLFELSSEEVFIDCGAFDGDTIEDFIALNNGHFKSIVAFEPDPLNWEKLQARLLTLPESTRERIRSLPFAIGSKECEVSFESTGTDVAKVGKGPLKVHCVTLDGSAGGDHPSIIKFDIEGSELDALAGARTIITKNRPILAVCCYHQQNHLWRIPLALAEFCADYKFFLRRQGSEGWDLVCFAVPTERLINKSLKAGTE